jgi:drug/metabolite transporter (DMT)-like permease
VPLSALSLVILAAILHATWNLYAKRSSGGFVFVWLTNVVATAWLVPLAAVSLYGARAEIAAHFPALLLAAALTSTFHLSYTLMLLRAYRSGDLSLVYPVVRGTGPLLAAIVGVLAFHEPANALTVAGTVTIVAAGLALGIDRRARESGHLRGALAFGVATGAMISCYTLWDKFVVSNLGYAPLAYFAANIAIQTLVSTPLALRERAKPLAEWRVNRVPVLVVGVLSPLAYLLILFALVHAPVSLVAPMRELSIVIAVLLGRIVLAEPVGRRRAIASIAIALGVIALSHG